MKRNPLAFVIIVAVALVLGWVFIWKPHAQRTSIRTVLVTDKVIGQRVAQQAGLSDVAWDQSKMVGAIVSGMRQIDLSGCPDDFREAYLRHVEAWASYQDVAESYGGWSGFLKGFFTGGGAVVSAYSQSSTAQTRIRATFDEVLRAAQRHGVSPP